MPIRFIAFALLLISGFGSAVLYAAEQKPLVFSLQKQKDPAEIMQSGNILAAELSKKLGREVKVLVPGEYSATVQALVSGHADVGYVSSLPFLLAKRDGGAELLLVEERKDNSGKWRTDYDSVLVARADGKFDNLEDIRSHAKSLRMVFTSHTSTSGYVFPFAFFREKGVLKASQKPEEVFAQVSYGGGYSQALQQVLSGKADIAAVSAYTVEGAKSAIYITPAEQKALKVIGRISGVPTHIIAVRAGLSPELRASISEALQHISKQKPELLEQVYGTARLVPADTETHVKATVHAISKTNLPIQGLVQ